MNNKELIKEARQHAEDAEAGHATGNAVLYRQLADALEAATEQ